MSEKRNQEAADEALAPAQGLARTLGDSDDWTLTAWAVDGSCACLAGHGDAGLGALRRVAAIRRKNAVANDWHAAVANVQVGSCPVALQRYAEAEPVLLKSVTALEASRGSPSDRTQAGYLALRDLYANTGRAAESAAWQTQMSAGQP
jgi:hypothetical protein